MRLVSNLDPILKIPTQSIEVDQLPGLADTFKQMRDQMKAAGGIGLAAPQVGLQINAFVMDWLGQVRTCVNPVVIEASPELIEMEEGCLSFPHLRLRIKRPSWAIVEWLDEQGVAHQEKLEGVEARVFLHEWDHCQGICFTDRVGKTTLMMAKKKADKAARRSR